MTKHPIAFNKPHMTGRELWYIAQAHANGHLSGDGPFTKRCQGWLEQSIGTKKALLTHSCTAALEMAAILADIQPGDEIIMPSYTFVSTANAFVLRGGIPVFVDIRPDTLNIDESKIEASITQKTKVIVPVHYAGVACEMTAIMAIANRYKLLVVEDAAQGIMSGYGGRPLGSFGQMAAISFHETKNIISGEGGALLINDPGLIERAEIIREKGTNRSKFFRGQVDKYTWTDIGSSYCPSELISAFLAAQIESANQITSARLAIWNEYHEAFRDDEELGLLRRPIVPINIEHNAHMYYLLLPDLKERTEFISYMREMCINTVFHYVPLHNSAFARSLDLSLPKLPITEVYSERIVRLPLWIDMTDVMIKSVISAVKCFIQDK